MDDKVFMSRAIDLAKRGVGWTSPNPLVGAVIVKDGRVIGEGWHHRYGDLHAERDALKNCTEDPAGATIYVTLEPCCHHGKQPPCTDALIEAGIRRVVLGSGDPNPLVGGQGVKILREHKIQVDEGVLEQECLAINDVFFHFITTGLPFVAMKYAMTMDGKIACYTGASKWVTGEKAREHVQTLRNRYRSIMVGVGTVLADDPMLNCRLPGGRSPIRIVCDSHLRTPLDAKVVQTADEYETIIATCVKDPERLKPYEEHGVSFIQAGDSDSVMSPKQEKKLDPKGTGAGEDETDAGAIKTGAGAYAFSKSAYEDAGCAESGSVESGYMDSGYVESRYDESGSVHFGKQWDKQVNLRVLLRQLGERKIDSILLEGGAQLNWSMLSEGLVNKVYTYIAPKLFGGAQAKSPVGGLGFPDPGSAVILERMQFTELGEDLLIESQLTASS